MASYEDFTEEEWDKLTSHVLPMYLPNTWVEPRENVAVAFDIELNRAPTKGEYHLISESYYSDYTLNPDKYSVRAGLCGRQVLPYVLSLPLEKLPLYVNAIEGCMSRLAQERLKIGK